jgi:hypothetical protein
MEEIIVAATEVRDADTTALEELSQSELALVGGGSGIMLFI